MAAQDISPPAPRIAAAGNAMLLWLVPAAAYYAFLLTAGSSGMFAPVMHGLTFNSMLEHMLHGRFDVDPAAIGDEGFVHDGATYAYFGIFPALFRALLLWLPNFAATDFTRLGCLVAVALMALFKVLSAMTVWRAAAEPRNPRLLTLLTVAILASGPQIEFLRPSIFQEVVLWAGAAAAAFVYLLLRGLTREGGFSPALLGGLAAAAGVCLSIRVSTALGLYVALGLVWLRLAWLRLRRQEGAAVGGLAVSAAAALSFAALAGFVNFARWGNPLTFVDLSTALIFAQYPEQLTPIQHYGNFNALRIGYGLNYYFLPLWILRDGAGQLWSAFQERTIGVVELPPTSFLLTDPLLLGLAGAGLVALWRGLLPVDRRLCTLAAGGLAIPAVTMLGLVGMTLRYRMEFYPLFELLAFLGLAGSPRTPTPRASRLAVYALAVGIVGSHLTWVLYMLSPFGPATRVLGPLGVAAYYLSLFQ